VASSSSLIKKLLSTALFSAHYPYKLSKLAPNTNANLLLAIFLV
jgi:hypothetical protein